MFDISTVPHPVDSVPADNEQTHHMADHEPLRLDNPRRAWQVISGHLALCKLAVENGHLTEKRRCLFTVRAGEIIFGAQSKSEELVALALEPSVLRPLTLDSPATA